MDSTDPDSTTIDSKKDKQNKDPIIGMTFEELDDAHKLWKSYGLRNGFNVRTEQRRKSKVDSSLYRAKYVCSKAGKRKDDKRYVGEVNHRWETKTNCQVQMIVKLDKNLGKYVIIEFNNEHNHELQTVETTRMMRDSREVTAAHAATIDIALDSGLTLKDTHEYMCKRAGGRDKLGYLLEDQKSYCRKNRRKNIADEYVGIKNYVDEQKVKNPLFQYYEQHDSDGWVASIFWAYFIMSIDYDAFGDVVIFDTTFGTNKETRSLGIFAGLNNHREITIFGAALLYDETIPTFVWLFETFLKANKGNRPKTFFTDQDPAMAAALELVLPKPQTHHALCVFHIWNNALTKLGNLMDGDSDISLPKSFQKCMHEYDTVTQFEEEWAKFVEKFGETPWLKSIYSVKEKWANCFMKNHFTLGIHSTQICESVNGDIKAYITRKLSMTNFFQHFDRMLDRKREKEILSEHRMRDRVPCLGNDESPILQQVSLRYTPCIFKLFQVQYNRASRARVLARPNDLSQPVHEYIVSLRESMGDGFKVLYNSSDNTVSCSCKYFDSYGILCYHCLKIYNLVDVMEIPEQYILERWTRGARVRLETRKEQPSTDESSNLWLKRMQDYFLSISYLASTDPITRSSVERMVKSCSDEVYDFVALRIVPANNGTESNNHNNIDNPNGIGLKPKVPTAGVKRKETWQDKYRKRATKKSARAQKVAAPKKPSAAVKNSTTPPQNYDVVVKAQTRCGQSSDIPSQENIAKANGYFDNHAHPVSNPHYFSEDIQDSCSVPTFAFDTSLASTSSMSYMELLTQITDTSNDIENFK